MVRRRSQAARFGSTEAPRKRAEATWPDAPRPSDVELALRDAQHMVRLLAANVEFLSSPHPPMAAETVADDIRAGTRRLGQLLGIISALLTEGD